MTKADAKRIAEEYVLQNKDRYKTIAKKEVAQAIDKIARALEDLGATRTKEAKKAKGRAA
jgi:hypothetical protein